MRKTKEIIFILLLSIMLIFTISHVSYAEEETCLSEESLNLMLNETRILFVLHKQSGLTVTWTSSNSNVATVNNEGKVTAVGVGNAVITATVGEQRLNCDVTVAYRDVNIKQKMGDSTTFIADKKFNLFLEKYPSKQLIDNILDYNSNEVANAPITWTSSDTNVATVDNTGKVTAVSKGTATITLKADTLSASVEVTVYPAPQHTDFSNATYELPFDYNVHVKIRGVTVKEKSQYGYMVTNSPEEPVMKLFKSGALDSDSGFWGLNENKEEGFFYTANIDKNVELNSDIYLWIVEVLPLDDTYCDDEGRYVTYDTTFVVKGEKLIKPELPKLNDIIRSFNIGEWATSNENNEDGHSSIYFRFPTGTEDRKFQLKIGKVTDGNILNKIHNNDYSGITSLLTYAKNDNSPLYNNNLVTTHQAYYRNSDDRLLDGRRLLSHKSFYYIYIIFDDENGTYVPVEAVTLAQAWLPEKSNFWDLYGYSDEKVEWTNLSSTPTEEPTPTTANKPIPYAGSEMMIGIIGVIAILGITAKVYYKKNNF